MLALGLTLTAMPTVAQDRFEVPLGSLVGRDGNSANAHDGNGIKMSFGSVGLDLYGGDSRSHRYFNIPDERSPKKAPGVLFRIPLRD
jgi:hypothetical protein